jgi:hypothetical protein
MKGCPVLALERQTLGVGAAGRIIASSTRLAPRQTGGSVVDYYGGPGTCSEAEVELWVDIAVVKVAIEEAGSDEVARPVPDVHGVAALLVVYREIAHGSEPPEMKVASEVHWIPMTYV